MGPKIGGAIVAVVALLAFPMSAFGATGDLTFAGCLGPDGCTTTTPAPDEPHALAVSPDGANVYETMQGSNVVFEYSRDPATSALTLIGCIGGDSPPCTSTTPAAAVYDPQGIAVSPDGEDVYVASQQGDGIDVFTRNPSSGALSFASCIGLGSGCTAPPSQYSEALEEPLSVAVSPDGKFVYAGTTSNEIDVLARTSTTALSFGSCLGDDPGCTQLPSTVASGVVGDFSALAISPNGAYIYAADLNSVPGTVASMARNATTGAVTFDSCLGDASGCTQATGIDIDYPQGIAVSPDGQSVYVPSYNGDSLIELGASSAGVLSLVGCVGDYTGCTTTTPAHQLDGSNTVAVSGDGDSVYVGSNQGITTFARDTATGALTETGCFADTGLSPCTTSTPVGAATQATTIAVAPDGASVYSDDTGQADLDEFSRAVPAASCSPASVKTPYATPVDVTPRCADPENVILGYSVVSAPAHGTAVVDGSRIVYTPASGYSGADSFKIEATSFEGDSAPVTVSVTVGAAPPPATQTRSVTIGEEYVVSATAPASTTCVAPGKKLKVSISSAKLPTGITAKLVRVSLYLDKGIRKSKRKHGHVTVSYAANAVITRLPSTVNLSIGGLKAGSHTLTIDLAYTRTEHKHKHKHKRTVKVTGKITFKIGVC